VNETATPGAAVVGDPARPVVVAINLPTVTLTGCDAIPLATTLTVLGPVSIVFGTAKFVEPAVPGATDIVLCP
jgi:hypothetical protein